MPRPLWITTVALVLMAGLPVRGEETGPLLAPPPDEESDREPPVSGDAEHLVSPAPSGGWANFLRELSQQVIPDEYEVRENWGNRTEVFSGFNVRGGDLVPRISKRTKRVKHGVWRRFRVRLINPEDRLTFEVRNLRIDAGGSPACDVFLSARLRCTANAECWNLGVKTGSATVQSDITLKAVAEFRIVGRQADPDDDSFFTEIIYTPDVADVRLRLTDLDLRRIGKVDGDVAEALGDASQKVVQRLVEDQEPHVRKQIREELQDADAEVRMLLPRAMLRQ